MRHARRPSRLVLPALAVLALVGSACRETSINRLLAEPHRYRDDEVALSGTVVRSVSVLGHGAYRLDDGTGTLWIVSTRGVPRQGARVRVRGRLQDVADLGSLVPLPPEVGSGLVLMETEHRAK